MTPRRCLLDTTTLSDVMKATDPGVARHAAEYLDAHGRFRFSIITRYEILRGLLARGAKQQTERFEHQCRESEIVLLEDQAITRAAQIYADLRKTGQLISDADILIAATAMADGSPLVTENAKHFARIDGLEVLSWRPT